MPRIPYELLDLYNNLKAEGLSDEEIQHLLVDETIKQALLSALVAGTFSAVLNSILNRGSSDGGVVGVVGSAGSVAGAGVRAGASVMSGARLGWNVLYGLSWGIPAYAIPFMLSAWYKNKLYVDAQSEREEEELFKDYVSLVNFFVKTLKVSPEDAVGLALRVFRDGESVEKILEEFHSGEVPSEVEEDVWDVRDAKSLYLFLMDLGYESGEAWELAKKILAGEETLEGVDVPESVDEDSFQTLSVSDVYDLLMVEDVSGLKGVFDDDYYLTDFQGYSRIGGYNRLAGFPSSGKNQFERTPYGGFNKSGGFGMAFRGYRRRRFWIRRSRFGRVYRCTNLPARGYRYFPRWRCYAKRIR